MPLTNRSQERINALLREVERLKEDNARDRAGRVSAEAEAVELRSVVEEAARPQFIVRAPDGTEVFRGDDLGARNVVRAARRQRRDRPRVLEVAEDGSERETHWSRTNST